MKTGSFFSGCGALDLAALAVLRGEVVWHCENSPAAIRVLEARWPGVPNIGDITTVDWSTVEPVDVVTGGFPCQDISPAGRGAGIRPGTRSGLWSHMAYAIGQLRPQLVIIENVRGLTSAAADSYVEPCPWCVGDESAGSLRALGAVLGDLADLGYDAEWIGLRAADVGAAHGRPRIFIVARPAADAGRVGVQRRADGGGVGRAERAGEGEGVQRERRGGAAGDAGPAAADAGGETVGLGPGLRQGGSGRLGRGRPDHGRASEPAADPDGRPGLGQRPRPQPRPGGELAAADADVEGREGPQSTRRHLVPAGGAAADAEGDRWDEGGPESARVERGPDAAERGPIPDTGGERRDRWPDLDRTGRAATIGEQAVDPARDSGRPSAAADTDSDGLENVGRVEPLGHHLDGRDRAGSPTAVEWGEYEPAIRRWEQLLERPAPDPTEPGPRGGRRLSPAFVEWLMGLPPGWVTDVPKISRNAQLEILGNAVVPQQAAAAIAALLEQ